MRPWRRRVLGAFALAVVPMAAWAHGPTRQKVAETADIAAPPAKIWAVIGHFHDLGWSPLVDHVTGSGDDTVGATRQTFLRAGGELDEELTKYDATGYAYGTFMAHVDPKVLPVTNYSSEIKVEAGDGGSSKVIWRGAFYRGDPNGNPPPGMTDQDAIAAVKAMFRGGLDALKQKVEAGS